MSFFKTKLRPADKLWTQFMRIKGHYTCVRCGKVYSPENCRNLGVSHYWSRSHNATRYDEDNCDLLCTLPCHQYWGHGEGRSEYTEYMIKKLGKEGYDALDARAHSYQKRDDKMAVLVIKELLNETLLSG